MRSLLTAVAAVGLAAAPAHGAELRVSIELPQLNVAEYHRPYLAAWIENDRQEAVANLAVWYDTKLRNEHGQRWLRDLRQWWRRGGRDLALPADGVSGATRAPGHHQLLVDPANPSLAGLQPGTYSVVVEVTREAGGRELVRVPMQWPPAAQSASVSGSTELGTVALNARP
ncbi:DUF2271 domain-containing protein [Roseococcus pinisoli]|uniref:DUF2271 domain-containing protein n=1 Tax=Roseococcus pinisoli TaxID=2835040 RepID=A0ABS5QGN2_9PROT|nr:DUF2271 domain-containing protein [Roseococcus pinisoli]MBS7812835.1 DUF2271 domain-containing protein [Roseococcus pinisoli]